MIVDQKAVLSLIQLRRDLPKAVRGVEEALRAIQELFTHLQPRCKPCFYEHGLVDECRCKKMPDVDKLKF